MKLDLSDSAGLRAPSWISSYELLPFRPPTRRLLFEGLGAEWPVVSGAGTRAGGGSAKRGSTSSK